MNYAPAMTNFSSVSSFQIFVPEKSGWVKYTQSWAEHGTWLCNFHSQDNSTVFKTALVTHQQAAAVWDRFKAKDTCETTFYS